MRILALDTATEACSAAVLVDHEVIGIRDEIGRGHAEQILGMVDRVLGDAGLTLAQLDGIAAGVGPGAFTGVRIGVAVAQGLAFGAQLPVVGVTSLEALAFSVLAPGSNPVLSCLDARMGEVYWGCFQVSAAAGSVLCAPVAVGPPDSVVVPFAGSFQGVGRGFAVHPALLELPGLTLTPEARGALPDAREMARLGALRFAAGAGIDPARLEPQYVRNKVALTEAERKARKAAPSSDTA